MKAHQIAALVGGALLGDPEMEVNSISDLSNASAGSLCFLEKPAEIAVRDGVCLLSSTEVEPPRDGCVILVDSPKAAFCMAASAILDPDTTPAAIHASANISRDAIVGPNASIGAFTTIGDGSRIGDDAVIGSNVHIGKNVMIGDRCTIFSNVCIYDNTIIGDDVTLHAGCVIGADGFGFVRHQGEYLKFPQIGKVVIGNNVEIGANTCVDRGALSETRIGDGTKIDNLVQIAHNVEIGKNVVIAAQTGISGSTVIEDDCVIGGQVGMGDHARVLSGAVIGSQAGVLPGKIVRPGVWWGTPIQPLDEYKKQNALLKGIQRLRDEVKELKAIISRAREDE
jgi:UDP-3-O-[3-hydroxymyristoyl] glucosamine N-acyltransferase